MDLSVANLRDLTVQSIRKPREAAARMIALKLGREVLWTALALIVTLSAIGFYITNVMLAPATMPPETAQEIGPMMMRRMSPTMVTLMVFGNMVVLIFALYWVGRMLGGKASLPDMILVLTWTQFLLLVFQVIQTAMFLVAPVLAAFLTLAALVYLFYVFLVFLTVAEGFDGVPRALLQLLITLAGVSVGLGLLLSLIGVSA